MDHGSEKDSSQGEKQSSAPRKSNKSKSILFVALIVIGVVGTCTWAFLSKQSQTVQPEPGIVDVGPPRHRDEFDLPAKNLSEDKPLLQEAQDQQNITPPINDGITAPDSTGFTVTPGLKDASSVVFAKNDIKKGVKITQEDLYIRAGSELSEI